MGRNPGNVLFGYEVAGASDVYVKGTREGIDDLEFLMDVFGDVDVFPSGFLDQNFVDFGFSDNAKVVYLFVVHER